MNIDQLRAKFANKELNTNAAKAPTSNEYWWRLTDLNRCIRVPYAERIIGFNTSFWTFVDWTFKIQKAV
jgi:hypothetical protein